MPAWRIIWSFAAKTQLLSIPSPHDAARVDAAVLRFAAGGGGELEHFGDPRRPYLRIPGYKVRLLLDPEAAVLTVLYVWRR